MRFTTRLACAATACLLVFAGPFTLAGSAGAAAALTLTGAAPATAHGPGTVTFTYTIVVPTAVQATVFTTQQDPALPARTSGVTLDGAVVPAGQISQSGASDITVQTGADPADGLAVGTHTITFTASVGTVTASTSSTAVLGWTESATPGVVTSAPIAVAVNQIDIATVLTPDSGEDQLGFLGTGNHLVFQVDVSNLGYGTPDTQLDVDLPTGVALGSDGVTRDADNSSLACAAAPGNAQHVLCQLGALPHATGSDAATLDIDLVTTPAAQIGQIVAVTAMASPKPGQGSDVNAANDSATAHLKFSGAAALTTTVTPAASKVELGATTTVKLTVHNAGPQPTGETIAFSILLGENLTLTGFSGNTTPPPDLGGPASASGPAVSPNGVIWFAGDIAPGHSISATLTLRATKLGTTQVAMFAFSEAGDPNCPDQSCDPTTAAVRVIAVPPKPVRPVGTSHPHAPASGSDPDVLANTGTATDRQIGIGGLLLLTGSVLLFLGRRPRLG